MIFEIIVHVHIWSKLKYAIVKTKVVFCPIRTNATICKLYFYLIISHRRVGNLCKFKNTILYPLYLFSVSLTTDMLSWHRLNVFGKYVVR